MSEPEARQVNVAVAGKLREAAELLAQQQASSHRVGAYRRAAETVEQLDESVEAILDRGGIEALDALPGIGASIAAAIRELVRTGRWSKLERLRGELDAEHLFRALPGVGPVLARRIHDELHVDTLEQLEAAAHDGRLAAVAGVGARRVLALRAELESALARVRGASARPPSPLASEPPVRVLLDVDREYRTRAAARQLPTIAPRRFNDAREAWLPVLHTERGAWHMTAMFSNTARAHRLGKTRDWVIVYFWDDSTPHERQRTVVTEVRGPHAGRRVVRGREHEQRPAELDPHGAVGQRA